VKEMPGVPEDRLLTQDQQRKILDHVHRKMGDDDRSPEEVCAERYGGDYNRYCSEMIRWLGIDINSL
jgi:hypothetical protein